MTRSPASRPGSIAAVELDRRNVTALAGKQTGYCAGCQKMARHAAEDPFAQARPAVCAGNNQVGVIGAGEVKQNRPVVLACDRLDLLI